MEKNRVLEKQGPAGLHAHASTSSTLPGEVQQLQGPSMGYVYTLGTDTIMLVGTLARWHSVVGESVHFSPASVGRQEIEFPPSVCRFCEVDVFFPLKTYHRFVHSFITLLQHLHGE